MRNANKTQRDVNATYDTNRTKGLIKGQDLETLKNQASQFLGVHSDMGTNGTQEADDQIQRLRQQVSSNVHHVLEGEKAQSLQVQTEQMRTRDTAARDQTSAINNQQLQRTVGQAVQDIIGGREHAAIQDTFEQEGRFHEQIKDASAQDQQNLDSTTRHVDQVVNDTLRDLNNLL